MSNKRGSNMSALYSLRPQIHFAIELLNFPARVNHMLYVAIWEKRNCYLVLPSSENLPAGKELQTEDRIEVRKK